jgi:hypothetical protein
MRVSDGEEKDRLSGDDVRVGGPILPVANATEKPQPAKPTIHSAVYVTYVGSKLSHGKLADMDKLAPG